MTVRARALAGLLGIMISAGISAADIPAPFVYVRGNAVFVRNPGDTASRQITGTGWTSPSCPVFADAAGRQVIFSAYHLRRFPPDRGLINLAVSNVYLSSETGVERVSGENDLSVSPDATRNGRELVLVSNRHARLRSIMPGSNTMELYLRRANWTEAKQITADGGSKFNPRLSWDGKKIAYLWLCGDTSGVYVMDIATMKSQRIAPEGNYPTWRPDGRAVAYVDRGRLFEVVLDDAGCAATAPRELLRDSFKGFVSFARWTRHGILFQWDDQEQEGISLLNPATGKVAVLVSGEDNFGGSDLAE